MRHSPYPSRLPDWSRWEQRGDWLAQVDWALGEWLRFLYLPLLIYSLVALISLVTLIGVLRTRRIVAGDGQALAVLVLGLGLFVQALSRYDAVIHVLPTALPALLLLGWLWQRLVTARWWRPFLLPIPALLTLDTALCVWLPALCAAQQIR